VALSRDSAQHMTGEGSEEHVHGGFPLDMQRFTWGAGGYLRVGAMMPLDGLTALA